MRRMSLQSCEELSYLEVILGKKLLWSKYEGPKVRMVCVGGRLPRHGCIYAIVMWWWVKVRQKRFHYKLTLLERTVYMCINGALTKCTIQFVALGYTYSKHCNESNLSLWGKDKYKGYRSLRELLGKLTPLQSLYICLAENIKSWKFNLKLREKWGRPEELLSRIYWILLFPDLKAQSSQSEPYFSKHNDLLGWSIDVSEPKSDNLVDWWTIEIKSDRNLQRY